MFFIQGPNMQIILLVYCKYNIRKKYFIDEVIEPDQNTFLNEYIISNNICFLFDVIGLFEITGVARNFD